MIRFELIRRISDKFGVEEIAAGMFVDRIFESMVTAFKKDKKINIPEFGKFNVINKSINGVRQRYVVFSPAKNFADSINSNFSDLEPIVVTAFNVKRKEILKVREIIPEEEGEEYLYFEFDDSGDEMPVEDLEPVIKSEDEKTPEIEKTETITEQSVFADIEASEEEKNETDDRIFNEEIAADVISHQTVFADNPIDIILPDGVKLGDFNENPEEQILENKKIIEEVEFVSSPTIRVSLKDDMNIDNIKEEILDILVRREEIIKELNAYDISEPKKDDVAFPETEKRDFPKFEDLIDSEEKPEIKEEAAPQDFESKSEFPKFENLFASDDKPVNPPELKETDARVTAEENREIFEELEKRIRELNELTEKKEELKKSEISSPMSQEMQIFGKLIDDTPSVVKDEPIIQSTFPEIIESKREPVIEYEEPKSLADALQDMKLDGVIEHLETKEVKSYDDIFRKSEEQFTPQYKVEEEDKGSQGKFFKGFLYFFFIFLFAAFSFYIYKTMFTKSSGNNVVDTVGLKNIDSVRALLKKTDDSLAQKDIKKQSKDEETEQTESTEIKNIAGVIYRELGSKIYIQNKVVEKLADANDLELKLKSNNLNCIVEGATKIDNGLEYRVLVGPFKSIEEAMEYYEKHKVVLNFMQIINPNQPNLLVF